LKVGDLSGIVRFRVASLDRTNGEAKRAKIDELEVEREEDSSNGEPDENQGNLDPCNGDSEEDYGCDGLCGAGHEIIDLCVNRLLGCRLCVGRELLAEGEIALGEDEEEKRKAEEDSKIHEEWCSGAG